MARIPTIITCAVTGAIHTPTMSDALPVTHAQIADQAIEAAEAGAAILHLHTRHPDDARPSVEPEHYEPVLSRLSGIPAVVNLTTGGAPTMRIEERIRAARRFRPEMASLNMGSMNFDFHALAGRHEEWRHDWERPYVEGSKANVFRNTFADIEEAARALVPLGVRFEHECYDAGHLYNLRACLDDGLFEPPVFVQFVMGVRGGIGADVENLVFLKRTADKLLGAEYAWSVLGAGAAQMPLALAAAQMGGHVRVGLEDSLHISRGVLARSNAQQVTKVRRLIEEIGREVASPAQAREILRLKGTGDVGY